MEETRKEENVADSDELLEEEIAEKEFFNRETFFDEIESSYDSFNSRAWNKGTGYLTRNFPRFNDCMEGLDAGLYMFAGESNSGKSAFVSSLMWDYVTNEDNNLFGIYFSLDDNAEDLIPRFIAQAQDIPISVVSKPQRWADQATDNNILSRKAEEYLAKREEGIEMMKSMNRKFCIIDSTKVNSGEQMLKMCKNIQALVRSEINPDANILVVIDSLSDMVFEDVGFRTDKELNDYIARAVKHWAVDILKCPILGTLHLRKIDQNRRPTVADVKESGRYVYEASFLGLIHNDVSRNKQAATIFADNPEYEEENPGRIPIIELDWAKNKKSSFKGRTFNEFHTNESKVIECSDDEHERINHIFYSV